MYKSKMSILIYLVSFLWNMNLMAQCNIGNSNLFLDYKVSECNGMTFQSAIGATVVSVGECSDDIYVSPLVGAKVNTNTKESDQKTRFKLFPNPSYGDVYIIFSEEVYIDQIQVFDIFGKLVLSQTIKSKVSKSQIDLTSFSDATYFIKVISSHKKSNTLSIVKMAIQ